MRLNHRGQSRLRVEHLEPRAMLAVTAIQDVNGNVFINGDNGSDQITLLFDGSGVTVFGDVDNAGPFANVQNLTINMGGGDDIVDIVGDGALADGDTVDYEVGGNLTVNLGAGADDQLNVFGVDVAGDVIINSSGKTSSNTAFYTFLGSPDPGSDNTIGGSLAVFGGNGDDSLQLIFGQIEGDLLTFMGGGNDTVDATNTRVDNVLASLGSGNADQLIWTVNFDGDAVDIRGSISVLEAESVSLSGLDDEELGFELLEIQGGLNIIGTGQADNVFISLADIDGLTLMSTGGGSDHVTIQNSELGLTILIGGGGTDNLDIFNSDIALLIENFEI